jgi:hypothetical protein
MTPQTSHNLAIAALAVRQHGNVTRAQLLAIGLGADAIKHLVRTGVLHAVHRGVYALRHPPKTPLERAAAAVLACGTGAALSHSSAFTLWDLDKRWHTPFEVVVASERRRPGITCHRPPTLSHRDITTQLGIRATTPARTLLDMARRLTEKRLTRAVNDALHSRFMHESNLAETLARNPHHLGHPLLIAFIGHPIGVTRSLLEDALIKLCQDHDLPIPLINVPICGYIVDAYFPHHGLIVELDSWEFHKDRQTFESDRNRDADTLLAGLLTIRITYERMTQTPGKEAARLRAILERLSRESAPDPGSPPRT